MAGEKQSDVPISWKRRRLGSVLKKLSDPVDVDATKVYREIGIRSHGKGIFHKPQVLGETLGNKRVFWVHPGCFTFNVVFAWEQAIAATSSNEEGMIASHRFPMYKPLNEQCDVSFLVYLFQTPYGKHLLGLASPGGAGRNRTLSQEGFLNTRINLPPLPEQQKISGILSTWDRAIDLTDKLIAAKQKRKQALMQQLLTGKVGINGAEGEWNERRLGKLATFVNGRAFKPAEWEDSGLPIIRIQNLNGSSDFNYFQGECDQRHRVFSGDLLFSWSGSRGTSFGPCFWNGQAGVLNQHIFRVIPHDGVQQRFLGHALQFVTVLIERKAHGSAGLVHVTKKELERYTVKVPPFPIQESISRVLDTAEREISMLVQRLSALRRQKTGLMQQLLTGKVRVNVDAETVKG